MGMHYKVIQTERKVLDKVICNRCRNEIKKVDEGGWNKWGEPLSLFHEPTFDSFFEFSKTWGMSSTKDGINHSLILCEPCYDVVFRGCNLDIRKVF